MEIVVNLTVLFLLVVSLPFISGTPENASQPGDNVMFIPGDIHPLSLRYIDDTGNITIMNYTVNDRSLTHYNSSLEEFEAGVLRENSNGRLVLHLPSGRNLTISVAQRTVVRLIDHDGKSDMSVDLSGFESLTMDDLKNDSSLLPVPSKPLSWPEPDWRPLRSVTVLANSSTVTITLNRNNQVFHISTNITHPGLVWFKPHGLVMLVVHPLTCVVTYTNIFPTSEFGGYRDLIAILKRVAPGRVIIIVGLYDGSLQMLDARQFLRDQIGSLVSEQYLFRDSWAWVFMMNGVTLGEAFSPNLLRDAGKAVPRNVTLENILKLEYLLHAKRVQEMKHDASPPINNEESIDQNRSDVLNITVPKSSINYRKKNWTLQALLPTNGHGETTTIKSTFKDSEDYEDHNNSQPPEKPDEDYDIEDLEYNNMNWNLQFFENKNLSSKTSSPLMLDARIPVHEDPIYLLMEYDNCKIWAEAAELNARWVARMRFCQTHDGYGSLCDCKKPFFLKEKKPLLEGIYEEDIPILLITANRTLLLFRVLEALGSQPGIHKALVTVVMDDWREEVAQLAYILDIKLLQHAPEGTDSVLVSRNLRFGLFHMLQLYPDAKQFIVLEDDLILSPDFYKYMQHTSGIFELDKTVYCVSAFNHLSYPHTSMDASRLYRVESFPAYGWMVPRREITYILPRWFPPNVTHDWDFMLGMSLLNHKKECIIPDVNRALHGGTVGLHARASWFHERHYSRRLINTNASAELMPMHRLRSEEYEEEMHRLISEAQPVNDFSLENFTLGYSKTGAHVLYVEQPNSKEMNITGEVIETEAINEPIFKTVGEAMRVWNTDVRELHKSTWRVNYRNQTLFVVGCPRAPYCKHMPKKYQVLAIADPNELTELVKDEYLYAHIRRIPFRYHHDHQDHVWRTMNTHWNSGVH